MHRFPNLTVIDHPLVRHKLAVLRSRDTSKKTFRALVDEIGGSVRDHASAVHAIEAGDADAAAKAMSEHLGNARKAVVAKLREEEEQAAAPAAAVGAEGATARGA